MLVGWLSWTCRTGCAFGSAFAPVGLPCPDPGRWNERRYGTFAVVLGPRLADELLAAIDVYVAPMMAVLVTMWRGAATSAGPITRAIGNVALRSSRLATLGRVQVRPLSQRRGPGQGPRPGTPTGASRGKRSQSGIPSKRWRSKMVSTDASTDRSSQIARLADRRAGGPVEARAAGPVEAARAHGLPAQVARWQSRRPTRFLP